MKKDIEKENMITKTVWQHTEILPEETMEFLKGIATDYTRVKASTYERYSGVGSLGKLASVYDIMTEMRHCGLREQLGLPSVYYELAVRDAVSDIKGMWGMLKNKIRTLVTANENLSGDDRMYLRTVLKLDQVYAAILNHEDYPMPEKAAGLDIDIKRLNSLLCRLTRRYLVKPVAGKASSFCVSPAGYAYKNHSLYLVSRIPRRRVMLPLKDSKNSTRQIRVCIKEDYAMIAILAEGKQKKHRDFGNTIYVHLGYRAMCTLSSGNVYGEELGELSTEKSDWLMEKNRERGRIRAKYRENMDAGNRKKAEEIKVNNLGLQKYRRQKNRGQAKVETYINTELNRMFKREMPGKIIITRPVTINKTKFQYGPSNRKMVEGSQGYVRKRLAQKCQENSIELVEINSKGTGGICSNCGAEGIRLAEGFVCGSCGFKGTIALNGARNIEKKYKESEA